MKYLFLFASIFASLFLMAQSAATREIEPDQETSFENYEVLIVAVLALLLLMGIRLWFKRRRNHLDTDADAGGKASSNSSTK
ncbi:MAG: hypothetical protein M3Q06_12890 [Bacteroidota bacterium]|nr:hypothetical protein [Bacteroidota bacterium]